MLEPVVVKGVVCFECGINCGASVITSEIYSTEMLGLAELGYSAELYIGCDTPFLPIPRCKIIPRAQGVVLEVASI